MTRITRNLSIILRSERLILQRHLNVLRRQTGLFAAAGFVGSIGLIMLNVAAYLALAERMSPALAALIVGGVDVVLAAIMVSIGGRIDATEDIAAVSEVRDMAIQDVEEELKGVADEARATTDALRGMARDPLGTLAPGLAGGVAKAVIKNLKR